MDWVPIVLFLTIGAVFCVYFYFRHRTRQELQLTVRAAIEQGQQMSPELLEALSGELVSGDRDLRRGVIWLALAAALGIMAWLLEPDMLGPAAFPLALGIAYLLLWRFNANKAADTARTSR